MRKALFILAVLILGTILIHSSLDAVGYHICGDANGDGTVNISDAVNIINYVFIGGDPPDPMETGDCNCDGNCNVSDAVSVINFIFIGGYEPCDPNDDGIPNCDPNGPIITDYDGNTYRTIKIGNQWWMMDNLKVTHYRNGDSIPNVTDYGTWEYLSDGAYCNYDNNEGHVEAYGRLYNWFALTDPRGLAPDGWHVPNDDEWQILIDFLGGDGQAGGKLKEAGTEHWMPPNSGATNESGFTALPAGYRGSGIFFYMGFMARFWSTTENYEGRVWYWRLDNDLWGAMHYTYPKFGGFSVRCVKNRIGSIVVDPSPDSINAPWVVTGPNGYEAGGSANRILGPYETGDYTITWGDLDFWIAPPEETLTLSEDDTIYFEGTYVSDTIGTVTDYDGNVYQAVKIGDQWWMAENLKVTHYRNGAPIPNVTDNSEWGGLSTGAYCFYDNNADNVDTYGLLYNWYAVDDFQNIAPEGWHVPSDEELKQLEMHLGMSPAAADSFGWRGDDEGGKLKETGTLHWESPNTGATNESRFTALPGGYRYSDAFSNLTRHGYFWASNDINQTAGFARVFGYDTSQSFRTGHVKNHGLSIRCVKD